MDAEGGEEDGDLVGQVFVEHVVAAIGEEVCLEVVLDVGAEAGEGGWQWVLVWCVCCAAPGRVRVEVVALSIGALDHPWGGVAGYGELERPGVVAGFELLCSGEEDGPVVEEVPFRVVVAGAIVAVMSND